jgi:nucleoside-diphosphate-sugar epimerase
MILVTGGDGFIGRHICSVLSKYRHDVIAVDRHFASPMPSESATGDLADRAFLAALFEQYAFDSIIHLASLLNTTSRQQPQEAMQVNIGISLSLLELAAQLGLPKFVYGSSISAYGSKLSSDHGNISEIVPAAPNDVYGISKRYVEVVGEAYRRQTGLPFVALRIATVVGAGAKSTSSMWRSALFEELTTSEATTIHIPYLPTEIAPLVHVEDIAEMIRQLVKADQIEHTIYNTPSESWRFGELASYISGLNKHIQFTFGKSMVDDIPQVIDDQRFIEEFGYNAIPLRQRMNALVNEY